jgi:hypothetical protein
MTSLDDWLLVATVECAIVDLTKEVLTLVNPRVLREVEAEDKQMTNKKNPQETKIVNAEPFVGSLSSKSCAGSKDGRNKPSRNCDRSSGRFQGSTDSDGFDNSITMVSRLLGSFHDSWIATKECD